MPRCVRLAPRVATGHRVRGGATPPRSRPIVEGDGGEAACRRRPAHRVLRGHRRRRRPHDPRAVLSDRRDVPLLVPVAHALRARYALSGGDSGRAYDRDRPCVRRRMDTHERRMLWGEGG